jgi:hypothetical protein
MVDASGQPIATPGVNPPAVGSPTVDPVTGVPTNPVDPAAPDNPAAPDDPTAGEPGSETCTTEAVGANPLRRLSRLEYQLTLKDLLKLEAAPDVSAIPEDPKFKNFRTVAELQTVSAQHLRGYADVGAELATALLTDETRRSQVIGCALDEESCLAEFTERFGRLAYRRALTEEEASALLTRAMEFAEGPEDTFTFVIEALLTSPSFVFRVEVGDSAEGLSTLSGSELAAKLSFSLLGRTPDDALLTLGESGALSTPEGLNEAAATLVSDPRAAEYFQAFFQQWLDFEEMRSPPTPPSGFTDELLPQMVEETELLLADFAWGGADFLRVLDANYTYAGPELAAFHGLPAAGAGASRVEFEPDHPRHGTGLLTHGALIGAKGDGDIIAHRGKWLLSTFLCQELELPAGLIDSLGTELEGLTRAEMLEKRTTDARCSSCHQIIDPIGVGFAQYDSAGRFDESVMLDTFPLVPALAGSDPPEFGSIAELATQLRERQEVPECLSERVFLFTQGREPASEDVCSVDNVTRSFVSQQNSFEQLLVSLVNDPAFRLRQAAAPDSSTVGVE